MRTADDAWRDPKPGDRFRGAYAGDGSPCYRTVKAENAGYIWYQQSGWGPQYFIDTRAAFCNWAATAEVLKVAQPEDGK